MEIRRSRANPCQVHFPKIKRFFKSFSNSFIKNYVALISHFLMRIRRTKVNPCRVLFNQKNNFVQYFLIYGKNKYLNKHISFANLIKGTAFGWAL